MTGERKPLQIEGIKLVFNEERGMWPTRTK